MNARTIEPKFRSRRPAAAPAAVLALAAGLAATMSAAADDPPATGNAHPRTRAEVRAMLEGSKEAKPRLPLPPADPEDAERARAAVAEGRPLSVANNGRMRRYYLPAEVASGGFLRERDPNMTLSYELKTMFFWIASRANNCVYCLGHQESKLATAGVPEELIAALDGGGDAPGFDDAQRAAFAFVQKLTRRPDTVVAADIDALRPHYSDRQILEIVLTCAENNAMNRWTGPLAIPQESFRDYTTPIAPDWRDRVGTVAPIGPEERPRLEPRAEVERRLSDARARSPRLELADLDAARAVWPEDRPAPAAEAMPEWVRLLANFPVQGKARIAMHLAADKTHEPRVDAPLKARIAWVAARHDRAWYALGHAERAARAAGLGVEDLEAGLADPDTLDPATRAVQRLTAIVTARPYAVVDADIEAVRAHHNDRAVAEILHWITEAAFFDRLTEAAGLRLEF